MQTNWRVSRTLRDSEGINQGAYDFLDVTQLPLIRRSVCMNVFHFVGRLNDHFFEDDNVRTGPGDLKRDRKRSFVSF